MKNLPCQNKKYDGGFTVDTNYTQNELKAAIKAGEFTFHKVNGVVRVLEDINSMVTTSDTCGDVFKDNQTIRVIDQLGNDDAVLFNTTKKRDVYITQDSSNINKWGILQYFDTLQKGENGQAKADALLKLYNKKTRNLKITND